MAMLAQLSLQRIEQHLPDFAGSTLPAKLDTGRRMAEQSLRRYVPDFRFDVDEAQAVTARVGAWADRNERSLSDAMIESGGDLPQALQVSMGSADQVQQFIVASYTQAAAGLGPWLSGDVARSVIEGEHANSWAQLDAESRLQTFGLIVRMDRSGELETIFRPGQGVSGVGGGASGLGVVPAVYVAIIIGTVLLAAAVVTYLYLNRRLELNNRLMRDLCERAEQRGDEATVRQCIRSTADLQISMFEEVGAKLLTAALVAGGAYVVITALAPTLLSKLTATLTSSSRKGA